MFTMSSLFCQNQSLVVDTVYQRYMAWKESYLLIGEGVPSKLIQNGKISDFPLKVDNFRAGILDHPLVESNGKCYLLNDALDVDPKKYIHLKINSLSHGGQHLKICGDKVTFVRGDSVFVSDFNTHEEWFVKEKAVGSDINENYVWVRESYSDKAYIYVFENNTLRPLPEAFKYPDTDHPNFVINSPWDENVHVLDLELNDVILPKEGYHDVHVLGDLLVIESKRHPIRVYRKDKKIEFDKRIIDVECRESQNACFLKNERMNIHVISSKENHIENILFDKQLRNEYAAKYSNLKKGNKVQVYNTDFELIFEGEYDSAFYIYNDRFIVEKDGVNKVVDAQDNVIISNIPKNYNRAIPISEFGTQLIVVYNNFSKILYDYFGNEITRWRMEEGDEYVNSAVFLAGINKKMLNSLNAEEEIRVNPWRSYVQSYFPIKNKQRAFIIDKQNNRLSEDYKTLIPITGGRYIIRTVSNKMGIIEIKI